MSWDIQYLFRRHAKELSGFLRRRGLSEDVAADLTQDTFLRVLANPPAEGAPGHNPRAYLFRVSQRLHANYRRHQRLIGWVCLDEVAPADLTDAAPTPERVVHARESLELTRTALAELPEKTRLAFEMHRIEELTLAEIGRDLNISTTRAWALVRDAYRHLLTRVDQF